MFFIVLGGKEGVLCWCGTKPEEEAAESLLREDEEKLLRNSLGSSGSADEPVLLKVKNGGSDVEEAAAEL